MTNAEFYQIISDLSDRCHGLTLNQARDVLASVVATVAHCTSDPDEFIMAVIRLIEEGQARKVMVTVRPLQ